MSSNPAHGEVSSLQYYVKQFVSDLLQVGGFIRVLRFPPPIKLTSTIYWNIDERGVALNTMTLTSKFLLSHFLLDFQESFIINVVSYNYI